MPSTILHWFGAESYREAQRELRKNMTRATVALRNAVINRIGTKFPPASIRGMPPHLRTGLLRLSIAREVVTLGNGVIVGRVGTNIRYGKYLELPRYLDRSFLMSTLNLEEKNIRTILSGKLTP
jgi:hypothetical protein